MSDLLDQATRALREGYLTALQAFLDEASE